MRRWCWLRPAGLIKAVRAALRIPLHILIRPRAGDFLYDAKELLVRITMTCCCCSSFFKDERMVHGQEPAMAGMDI